MAQGCIGSFSLKNAIANLLAQINNTENSIWLEGSIFLIPEEKLLDGNFDECISLHAQLKKTWTAG